MPLKDGTEAQDVTDSGKEGEEYQTSEIEDQLLSDNYEIAEVPENAEGTYSGDEVIVIYYYRLVERPITIVKTGDNGEPLEGVEFRIQAKEEAEIGNIEPNGRYYFVEQNGKYISNNQNQSSTTANSYIKIDLTGNGDAKLTINAEISSESRYDYGYATITQDIAAPSYNSNTGRFIYISGQVSATDYETILEGGKVYYLHLGYRKDSSENSYNDTFTINSININEIEETYITDSQGKINVELEVGTYEITEIEAPDNYQLPENPTTTLTVTKDTADETEVQITNNLKQGTVIVHHYIYDKVTGEYTENKVPLSDGSLAEDEVKTGDVGSIWASQAKENLVGNYELYEQPEVTSGLITEDPQEIIYYYVVKDAEITNTISKTGTDKITEEDEAVNYTINYHANVNQYAGTATVTIVDELPYSIDTSNPSVNLDGGTYNEETRTITWTERVENIDTYTNGPREIDISKNITVVYVDMDYSKTSFENRVQGTILIESTGQQEDTEEAIVTTETEFKVDVEITKIWDHTNNIYGIPSSVVLQVKNGNEVVDSYTVTEADGWKHTFTGLDKYDENGEEIVYTAGEAEVTAGDLDYYESSVNGTSITNTYNGPVISQSKSVTTENGQNYVVEGEKITYTITVTNDGGVAKDVTIIDNIPDGTTFVENSIKVDNEEITYGASKLSSGLTVNVGANSEVTVSFEVTVNELEENVYLKEIRNIANVDGNDTEETVTTVNKPNLTFNKEITSSGDKVTVGDEITYTITLNNSGTLETEAVIKDSIPEGTTFVESSIKLNDEETEYTEEDLTTNGIEITVGASETVRLSFRVEVNDLEDRAIIRNTATVNDTPTEEVTVEYVEPVISNNKTQSTENNLAYVVEGERITYTITVTNDGGLAKDVVWYKFCRRLSKSKWCWNS